MQCKASCLHCLCQRGLSPYLPIQQNWSLYPVHTQLLKHSQHPASCSLGYLKSILSVCISTSEFPPLLFRAELKSNYLYSCIAVDTFLKVPSRGLQTEMDSQQPENRCLHLFCPRRIDNYHPSMGNPVDVVTSRKLTTMQWERKFTLPVPQKTTNHTKPPNHTWMLGGQPSPRANAQSGRAGAGSRDMRPLTSAENDCSRKIQDEKSHLAIPRHLNNSP